MIIDKKKFDSYSLNNGTRFQFADSPAIFNILSDNLYSNKIDSIVRELSCNARDAHTLAGKVDAPFNIFIEEGNSFFSDSENMFRIRDFGVGLSEEEIYNLYTVYGLSNKTHTNDYIGGFGIGSKSPFAYTDSFIVTSWYNGEKKVYCAFKNSEGYPEITKISETVSDEPVGIEVSLPIQKGDVENFKLAVKNQLKYFNVKPNLNYNYIFEDGVKYRISEKYFIPNTSGVYVLMSDIAYEVDLNKFYSNISSCNNNNICFQIDIGDIDLSASREHISYTEKTKKFMYKKFAEYKEFAAEHIWNIKNSLSRWEFVHQVNMLFPQFLENVTVNNQEKIDIVNSQAEKEKERIAKEIETRRCKMYVYCHGALYPYKKYYGVGNMDVVAVKGYTSIKNNIRKLNLNNNCFVISYSNNDAFIEYMNNIGNPNVKFLEIPTECRKNVENLNDSIKVFPAFRSIYSQDIYFNKDTKYIIKYVDIDKIFNNDNVIFIPIVKYQIKNSIIDDVLVRMLYFLRAKTDIKIYGIQTQYIKKLSHYVDEVIFTDEYIRNTIGKSFIRLLDKSGISWYDISDYTSKWEIFNNLKKNIIRYKSLFTDEEYNKICHHLPFMNYAMYTDDRDVINMACLYREFSDKTYTRRNNESISKILHKYPVLYYMLNPNTVDDVDMFKLAIKTHILGIIEEEI